MRPLAKAVEVEAMHELGHRDGHAIDHVGVEDAGQARIVDAGGALGGLDEGIGQIDRAAAPAAQTLDGKDAIETGQAANACAIGLDAALDANALLKFVPAKLARLGLIANHGESGCICHQW